MGTSYKAEVAIMFQCPWGAQNCMCKDMKTSTFTFLSACQDSLPSVLLSNLVLFEHHVIVFKPFLKAKWEKEWLALVFLLLPFFFFSQVNTSDYNLINKFLIHAAQVCVNMSSNLQRVNSVPNKYLSSIL